MSSENSLLQCIEINPAATPTATVIVLHGLGADGSDFVSIVKELNLPKDIHVRFVFPNAPLMPITINNGYVMPAWYDVLSMNIDQRADKKGIDVSVEKIQQLIAREEKLGVPANKIVVAGFSQGAVIALTTGLRAVKPLAGLLALSGYLPFAEDAIAKSLPVTRNIPIFMAHGTQDRVVPYALGEAAYNLLKKTGFAAGWQNYEMGHSVCAPEITDIGKWLSEVLA
jgi:phospholipase/carboxylesterase